MLHKNTYIFTSLIATLLSVAVWLCGTKEYSAYTKVSDEYRETDLAIGLNTIQAQIRDEMQLANTGVNDIAIYSKWLKTNDFARYIANVQVSKIGTTYGEWLMSNRTFHLFSNNDTIAAVNNQIEYNYSSKQETLTVEFTDSDPIIASLMLDSVIVHLQNLITIARHNTLQAQLINSKRKVSDAYNEYEIARDKFVNYSDSHFSIKTNEEQSNIDKLEKEWVQSQNQLQNATEEKSRLESLAQRSYCSFAVIQNNTTPINRKGYWLSYFFCFNIISLFITLLIKIYHKRSQGLLKIQFGNIYSPWVISITVWIVLFVFFKLSNAIIDPVGEKFYTSIAVWLTLFVVSSFMTYNLLPHNDVHTNTHVIEINNYIFQGLFVFTLILTPLYIYQIYKLIMMFDTKDLMYNVRSLAIGGGGFGVLNYSLVLNQVLLLVALWRYPKIPLWQLIVIIISSFVFALARMEKISFFLIIIAVMYVLLVRRVIRIRTILPVMIVLVVLFYLFNLSRSGVDSDYSNNETFIDFLGMYLFSPPVAFEHLHPYISNQFCSVTLNQIYLYLNNWFGCSFTIQNAFSEFVFVPVPTNVYTILRPFYLDGGLMGIASFAILYGVGCGYVYAKSTTNNPIYIVLYTYIVFVLLLQFFDELIFSTLSLFAQRLILIIVVCQNTKNLFGYQINFLFSNRQ